MINSGTTCPRGTTRLPTEIFQIKARIAPPGHCLRGAANSGAIGKIHNAKLEYFSRKIVFHKLIRGSLV